MSEIDYFQRLTEVFTFDNTPLLVGACVSNIVGYIQYAYVVRLTHREGRNPMPYWMHSFYLAHDSSWSYILAKAAPSYGNHWFLSGMSTALLVWTFLEAWTMYKSITTDRELNFAPVLGRNPSLPAAAAYAAAHLAAMYALIHVVILLFPTGGVLHWCLLTNVLIATGPLHHNLRAGSRQGLSLGYSLVCIFGTFWTFSPFGLFVNALPELFDTPVFYAVGVVFTIYCAGCFYVVAQYPPKTRAMTKGGKEPIW
ncbi:hypothetical protein KVR01_013367 [Diaporthe batatas]|uniref:uncharacterized protein n=1 Tax=Diaporthe batatas TaxID=748121 RepID=UPI001D052187|nr:uncharacterized protein KVR01_013367 [Diaporthe batatas]KAG8156762.1 hypothetical protein KVR01_013367 [Diaporthe batatas]